MSKDKENSPLSEIAKPSDAGQSSTVDISIEGFEGKKLPSKALKSVDQLVADLIQTFGLIPRAVRLTGEAKLQRYKERLEKLAIAAHDKMEKIPIEARKFPQDKTLRMIVSAAEVEDDTEIQEMWARLLAQACDARQPKTDPVLLDIVSKMVGYEAKMFCEFVSATEHAKSNYYAKTDDQESHEIWHSYSYIKDYKFPDEARALYQTFDQIMLDHLEFRHEVLGLAKANSQAIKNLKDYFPIRSSDEKFEALVGFLTENTYDYGLELTDLGIDFYCLVRNFP